MGVGGGRKSIRRKNEKRNVKGKKKERVHKSKGFKKGVVKREHVYNVEQRKKYEKNHKECKKNIMVKKEICVKDNECRI